MSIRSSTNERENALVDEQDLPTEAPMNTDTATRSDLDALTALNPTSDAEKEAMTEIGGVKPVWLWLWITPATGGASPASVGIPESAPVIVGTVAASPNTVRTSIGTPPPIKPVWRAVRGNPSASPLTPMRGHRMPAPTAGTPHFDDTRRCNNGLHARPQRNAMPRYRSG